jgi:uncharacterized protein (TIGR03083 family)
MATDIWPTIHAERAALADDLAGLPDERWSTPSLCDEWTVLQVLGHMTATAKMTPGRFFGQIIGSGFRFDHMLDKAARAETSGGPAVTLAEFRAHATDTTSPPGPKETWIGEAILHSEDIRRPLGITRRYDPAAVTRVADFYKKSNAVIGARKRIDGLRLRATDADWSTGDGPEVAGPILSLAMAMTGRAVALDDLTGEGVGQLRSRM